MDITLSSSHIGGTIFIPASKSQTIRALLIATFAEGESLLVNPLDSQDTRSCLDACKAFGAEIIHEDNALRVIGKGLPKKPVVIDCGNSGTTLYLATAMASASDSPITFTGDEQLCRRPVGNLLNSLVDLGVKVESTARQTPPFTVRGPIIGGTTSIECPTSQYLSALMLGLPLAKDDTIVLVPL
ncbi:MAG: 3-phosphoshikimate 1-carboxyvinyltransferase, partial [Sphaerochaetaceae bacterium]